MGPTVTKGSQVRLRASMPPRAVSESPSARPVRFAEVLLLDPVGGEPVPMASLTFGDEGIGVVEHGGSSARVLPWSSVTAHVAEAWSGGLVPEWWVDPELDRDEPEPTWTGPTTTGVGAGVGVGTVTDPEATARPVPHVEAGTLVGIRTPTSIYRFLIPHSDPVSVSRRINEIALARRPGTVGVDTTTVLPSETPAANRAVPRSTWSKIQPFLVIALIAFIATAVTLILLQSSGAIHLPFLGGANSGSLPAPTLSAR